MNRLCSLFAILLVTLLLSGCATKVSRIETDEVKDLSGAWNDTDSRMVSEEMIADMLERPWVGDFRSEKGTRPAVIVGTLRNLSHEHINLNTFVADVERALVNSGRVDFVASATEREEIRGERGVRGQVPGEAEPHEAPPPSREYRIRLAWEPVALPPGPADCRLPV